MQQRPTSTCIYGGLNILYEKVGSIVTGHFHGNGLQLAKITGTSTYYYRQDAIGSTRLVPDASISNIFGSNYKPYDPLQREEGAEDR